MRPIWGAINSKRKGKKYSFESFLNKKVRDKIIKKEGHLIENFTIGEMTSHFQQIIMVFLLLRILQKRFDICLIYCKVQFIRLRFLKSVLPMALLSGHTF